MRDLRLALGLLLALGLSSCGPTPQVGGAGAEAGNAITVSVLSQSGEPVAGASVEIRPYDSDDPQPTYTATTGTDGMATIELSKESEWSVVARKDGKAFWNLTTSASDTILDTLRPTSQLAGMIEGAPGAVLSLPGIGARTISASDGSFEIAGLPSGFLPLRLISSIVHTPATRAAATHPETHKYPDKASFVPLDAGRTSILVTRDSRIPSDFALPADTLIPWSNRPLPAFLPIPRLIDTASFATTVLFRITDTTGLIQALSWGKNDSEGIRIGWEGTDTMIVELDGVRHKIPDCKLLAERDHQIGIYWNEQTVSIHLNGYTAFILETNSFVSRSSWGAPEFGRAGIDKVVWMTTLSGSQASLSWMYQLNRMWYNFSGSSISGSGG